MRGGSKSFLPAREHRLEMWRLVFGGDDADFDFFETGFLQPTVQVTFSKTQPAVTVEFVRFLELVGEQIENQNLAAGLQDFVRAAQCQRRGFGVMQGLA